MIVPDLRSASLRHYSGFFKVANMPHDEPDKTKAEKDNEDVKTTIIYEYRETDFHTFTGGGGGGGGFSGGVSVVYTPDPPTKETVNSLVGGAGFSGPIKAKPDAMVRTFMDVGCPGSADRKVLLTNESTTQFGLRNLRNDGDCPLAINGIDSAGHHIQTGDPNTELILAPGESASRYLPPTGSVFIAVACFENCEGCGKITYDQPIS